MLRRSAWLTTAVFLFAVGCIPGEYKLVPVTGRILLNGLPLENATITFQPQAGNGINAPGPGSYGRTDAEGRFELKLALDDRRGAVPGKHSVTISRSQASRGDHLLAAADEGIPLAYRNGTTAFIVPPEGTEQAEFVLGKSE